MCRSLWAELNIYNAFVSIACLQVNAAAVTSTTDSAFIRGSQPGEIPHKADFQGFMGQSGPQISRFKQLEYASDLAEVIPVTVQPSLNISAACSTDVKSRTASLSQTISARGNDVLTYDD